MTSRRTTSTFAALFALCGCASAAPPAPPTYRMLAPSPTHAATTEATPARNAALASAAQRIIDESLRSHRAYALLTELCDDIGARLSGSAALERALAWAEARLREAGHEGVRIEPVMVQKWVRGAESLALVEPEARSIPVLGIGGTVGTPKAGITAELVAVDSEESIATLGEAVRGKIVLIDHAMPEFDETTNDTGYGKVFGARVNGASLAAKQGALAVLVRSLTANSLATLHTGALRYDESAPRIPAASVTIEDASYLRRLLARKGRAVVKLALGAEDRGLVPSGNVVAELRGRDKPDEVVVIGGHIDSWDVGQGAHDDGAGVVISMEALATLRTLGLVPRRTIRVVLFTNEENGVAGAREYQKAHAHEKHVAAIETDTGGTRVVSLGVDLADDAAEAARAEALGPLLSLLAPLAITRFDLGHAGADVSPLVKQGALGIGLIHEASHYFDVHHTAADTLDKVDPDELAHGVAAMAVVAYALAEAEF